jgi:hypothetical protein
MLKRVQLSVSELAISPQLTTVLQTRMNPLLCEPKRSNPNVEAPRNRVLKSMKLPIRNTHSARRANTGSIRVARRAGT